MLDDLSEIKSELVLVDSSLLKVIVSRNLQIELFKDIEPVKVSASYDGLSIYLSKQDYTFLLTLSQENFSESVQETVNSTDETSETKSEKVPKKEVLRAKVPSSTTDRAKKEESVELGIWKLFLI